MSASTNTVLFGALISAALFIATADADENSQMALSAQSLQMWSNGDTSAAADVFTKTYKNHQEPDVQGGPKTVDLAEWTATVQGYQKAFPKTDVEIILQLADGDYVTSRWRFTATQEGVYLGRAPAGKTVTWTGIQIDRFDDGKIAESWVNWDMYSMFKQLGLLN